MEDFDVYSLLHSSYKEIDFLMTAIPRPKIIKKSITSIFNNLRGIENFKTNLYINIDQIGMDVNFCEDLQNFCKNYFSHISINVSSESSLPAAIIRLWGLAKSTLVFHWEDDFVLNREINIYELIYYLDKYNLATLRLDKSTKVQSNKEKIYRGKKFWGRYDKNLYIFKGSNNIRSFSLNPFLCKLQFIKTFNKFLDESHNAEKILGLKFHRVEGYTKNKKELIKKINRCTFGIYNDSKKSPLVEDFGRQWRKQKKFNKSKGGLRRTYE